MSFRMMDCPKEGEEIEIVKFDRPEDKPIFRERVKSLKFDADPVGKKVLADCDMMYFRGVAHWVGFYRGVPVTLNATHFGKRKKNAWEPYANFYTAYTSPEFRQRGIAKSVAWYVRELARQAGCVRLKSLAGSRLGYHLHRSMGDLFWGLTPAGEMIVDTPIVTRDELHERGRDSFPHDTPPMSIRTYLQNHEPLTPLQAGNLAKTGLRYDLELEAKKKA